jgi:hypothetical protein
VVWTSIGGIFLIFKLHTCNIAVYMKNLVLLLSLALTLFACSGNDDDGNGKSNENYFPAATGSYWTYTVEGASNGRDSLYSIASSATAGMGYNSFGARQPIAGLYTNLLSQSQMRNDGGIIYLKGTFSNYNNYSVDVPIELNDVPILDPSKAPGAILSSETQEITFPQEIGQNTYDIVVSAEIRTAMIDHGLSRTVNGVTYNNISASTLVITATAVAMVELDGITVSLPVLEEQEILRMDMYFARDIGLIYAESTIKLELSPAAETELNITSYLEEQRQELDTYLIATP